MRISDWSSDLCSSDLSLFAARLFDLRRRRHGEPTQGPAARREARRGAGRAWPDLAGEERRAVAGAGAGSLALDARARGRGAVRSEEHTSELQSLMRISYAVFCLKKKRSEHKQTEQKTKER